VELGHGDKKWCRSISSHALVQGESGVTLVTVSLNENDVSNNL